MPSPKQFGRNLAATFTAALLVAVLVGCNSSSSEDTSSPRETSSSEASSTSDSNANKSLKDFDMCKLLTPEDLPVKADQGGKTQHRPEDDGDTCAVTVQMRDIFSILTVSVTRKPDKFRDFVPPPGSPNGKFSTIAGRKSWIGNPVASGSDKNCGVATGAADGYLDIVVLDETQRGVDPCQTAIGLAEKVIARTPEPYDK